jgi:deoxyribodipyrimidine photolyase-related protein
MGKSVGRKNTAVINAEATNKMSKTARLILGDQLNSNHSWFKTVDESVVYVMMEVRSETDYAKQYSKKVVSFLPPCKLLFYKKA